MGKRKKKAPKHYNKKWEKEDRLRAIIRKRGRDCFYCGKTMKVEEMTIEHFQAKSNGGGWKLWNLYLAHLECNVMAGNLPRAVKLKLKEVLTRKNTTG